MRCGLGTGSLGGRGVDGQTDVVTRAGLEAAV